MVSRSIFTLVGIGFFAVWSVPSNITSGIILTFRYPLRLGDIINVGEDASHTARVVDIKLFFLLLQDEEGRLITMPHNVAIQKTLIIERPAGRRAERLRRRLASGPSARRAKSRSYCLTGPK